MAEKKLIVCAFCHGRGRNPHYQSDCPVCKGKGKNQINGSYMKCQDCKGTGRKSGTVLSCYQCLGLGVIPDIRETLEKARCEMGKIQKEMEKEKNELYQKVSKGDPKICFCQSCAEEKPRDSIYKVCEKCFSLYKFGEVRKKEKEKKNEG